MVLTPEQIISSYLDHNSNALQTSLTLCIDIRTVRRWVKRSKSSYGRVCKTKIVIRSRARKDKGYTLTASQERQIVELRKEKGLDQTKVADKFYKTTSIKISPKTVYNIIKRREPGLIRTKPKYRRPRFQNGNHMRPSNTTSPGYTQLDVKHVTPELSGLPYTTYEYAFIDIYSRYKIAWIMPSTGMEETIVCLKWAIKQFPFPIRFIQTDNGWEFGKRFHDACTQRKIEHYYIHKSSPNENAVIERSFRTDQEEFYYQLKKRPQDINDLNIQLQEYMEWYNKERPHLSLKLKTPLEYFNDYYKLARCDY